MNEETVVNGPARPEGRLARRWRWLHQPAEVAPGDPVKRIDLAAIVLSACIAVVGSVALHTVELAGLGSMLQQEVPDVLRDGPLPYRVAVWVCLVITSTALASGVAYSIYLWCRGRKAQREPT